MFIRQILNAKAYKGVVTAEPSTPLKNLSDVLSKYNFGCLVISGDGFTADGILSERDIVRAFSRHGSAALELRAEDVMTRHLFVCSLDDDVDRILATMSKHRFRHMPVVEGKTLVGLVTLGDMVKAKLSRVSMENEALENMIKGY